MTFTGKILVAALASDGRTLAYATTDESGAARVLIRDIEGGEAIEVWRGALVNAVACHSRFAQGCPNRVTLAGSVYRFWDKLLNHRRSYSSSPRQSGRRPRVGAPGSFICTEAHDD